LGILYEPRLTEITIRVRADVSGQANPANQAFLRTEFNTHAISWNDANANGVFDAGEVLYDPSYDNTAGTINRAGYTSVGQIENTAVQSYRYLKRYTVTAVDASGIIASASEADGEWWWDNDMGSTEMKGVVSP
jgi:hypothetical protein